MSKLADKLQYLLETKTELKEAIESKGQTVSEDDTFREYADKIKDIETGTDTDDATASSLDILSPKTAYIKGGKVTGEIIPVYDTSVPVIDSEVSLSYTYTFDDIDMMEYKVAVCCSSSSTIQLYGITKSGYTAVTNTINSSSFVGTAVNFYSGTARFAREYTIIDNVKYLRLYASAKTVSGSQFSIATCLVNVDTLETVDLQTYVIRSASASITPAMEPVPLTDNKIFYVACVNTGGINYGYSYLITVSNNIISSKLIYSGYTSSSTTTTAASCNSINFDVDNSTILVVMEAGLGRMLTSKKEEYKVILKTLNKFQTYETILAEMITPTSAYVQYAPLSIDYIIKGDKIYRITDLTNSVDTVPFTLTQSHRFMRLGKYYFVTTSGATTMDIYEINDTTLTLTASTNIKANSIFKHYCDRLGFVRNNNILNVYKESDEQGALVQMTRSGVTYYNTEDASTTVVSDVLSGKTFYNRDGKVKGTMVNRGATTLTPSASNVPIPQGYHNGDGYVIGDADLVPENIMAGKTIFNVTGSAPVIFNSLEELEEHKTMAENTIALVYMTNGTYLGSYKLVSGEWVPQEYVQGSKEAYDYLCAVDGDETEFTGSGDTDAELNDILDQILGTTNE